MTKIKICGLSRVEDIETVNEVMPDFIGFVFAKSKRQVSIEKAAELKSLLNPDIKAVGVFVNEELSVIKLLAQLDIIDIIQLHGDENSDYIMNVKKLGKPVIKAVRVADTLSAADENADFVLFDKHGENAYGGLGESFDWELLRNYSSPYFLAGGVNIQNLSEALALNPYAIDISSGVEENGVKSKRLIEQAVKIVRNDFKEDLS